MIAALSSLASSSLTPTLARFQHPASGAFTPQPDALSGPPLNSFAARFRKGKCVVYIIRFHLSNLFPAVCIYFLLTTASFDFASRSCSHLTSRRCHQPQGSFAASPVPARPSGTKVNATLSTSTPSNSFARIFTKVLRRAGVSHAASIACQLSAHCHCLRTSIQL